MTPGNKEDAATRRGWTIAAVQTLPRRKTWPQYGETLAPDLGPTEHTGQGRGVRVRTTNVRTAYVRICSRANTATCLYILSVSYSTQPNLGCTDIFTGSTAFTVCMITRKRNSFPDGKWRRRRGDQSGLLCLSFPPSLRPLWSSFVPSFGRSLFASPR